MPGMLESLDPAMASANRRLSAGAACGIDWVLAAALGVGLAALAYVNFVGAYHAGFSYLHPLLNGALPDFIWAGITRLGDERVLALLAVLFARRRPEVFWALIVAAVFAALYSRLGKLGFGMLRPPAVLDAAQLHLIGPSLTKHSFPSGHTTSVFVFMGTLMVFAREAKTRWILFLAATVVGLSRIAVGVHWPHDVLAGAFGGLMAAALGAWLAGSMRWGLRPGVHLGLMILPLVALVSLLLGDNGNPHTPWLIYPLVLSILAQWVNDYWPWWR